MKTEYRRKKEERHHKKAKKKKEIKKVKEACHARQAERTKKRSSKEEHRADALALRAEERRDKLRKAAGSGIYTLIRRCLNGETHAGRARVSIDEQRQECLNSIWRGTRRTETSK